VAPYEVPPENEAQYLEFNERIATAYRAKNFEDVSQIQQAQAELCVICETFRHSLSDPTAKPMRFHAQVLADIRKLIEASSILRSCFASVA